MESGWCVTYANRGDVCERHGSAFDLLSLSFRWLYTTRDRWLVSTVMWPAAKSSPCSRTQMSMSSTKD